MSRHTIIRWADKPEIDWTGQTAIIVASGPSAAGTDFDLLVGHRVIAINRSWELVPWADVLFGMDGQFWHHHQGVPTFGGRKVTASNLAAQAFGLDLLFSPSGNNSGVRALYLAEAYGVTRALLVGFDMHPKAGVHWHEKHGGVTHNPGVPEMRQWRAEMDRIAPVLAKRGMTVINCTPGSALTCFPKMSLREALDAGVQDRAVGSRSQVDADCAGTG